MLFDLDGTILDSSRPVLAAWTEALSTMGLPVLPEHELHRVIGPPMQHVVGELLAERGAHGEAARDELVRRFRAAIHDVEVAQAVAYEGMPEVVRQLHEQGRRRGIVTSKPLESARRVVPALGIAELFVHLEAPPQAEPEEKTATMARAVAAMRLDPDDTVMVGDRHHDVTAAAAHGIATIGVTWAAHADADELADAGAVVVVDDPGAIVGAVG